MEYRTLNNGVRMPAAGYGTWDLRGRQCVDCIREAVSAGYRLIDTAIMYGNEAEVGEGVRTCGVGRDELFITTKINSPYASYEKTLKAVDHSLRVMKLDYLDLVLIHEPYPAYIEMYKALETAYKAGKVRAVGVSNQNSRLYDRLLQACEIIPAVDQVECHVYYPQPELKAHLEAHGTVMESWAPFTEGRRKIFREPVLNAAAEAHGKTAGQIALKYLLQNGVIVIPKTSRRERMEENIGLFDFTLREEEMKQISALNENRSLFGWYD